MIYEITPEYTFHRLWNSWWHNTQGALVNVEVLMGYTQLGAVHDPIAVALGHSDAFLYACVDKLAEVLYHVGYPDDGIPINEVSDLMGIYIRNPLPCSTQCLSTYAAQMVGWVVTDLNLGEWETAARTMCLALTLGQMDRDHETCAKTPYYAFFNWLAEDGWPARLSVTRSLAQEACQAILEVSC